MQQWWRLGGVFGIGFIILFIIGVILQGESPTYDDPIDDIRAYWSDDGQAYLVGDYLIGLAFLLFFLPFLVSLRSLLGLAEGSVQMWSRTAFAAGIIAIVIGGASSTFWGALAFGIDNLGDETVRAFMYAEVYGSAILPMALAVLLFTASLVIFRTGVLWQWLAILGVIAGIAGLLTPLGILDDDPEDIFDLIGFIAYIGFAVWLLLTSIAMVMKKDTPLAQPAMPSTMT
jgi:hypothetical protein